MTSGLEIVALGKGRVRRRGRKIAILGFGTLVQAALAAAEGLDATVADMRFVKPLDRELLRELAASHDALVTLEDAAIMGGAGSAVTEALNDMGLVLPVLHLGLPDEFIDHGDQLGLLAGLGLDAAGIERSVRERFSALLDKH
ncbi:transketolase, C-terminal domain protein [Bordetella holmesii 44057]|nr:transketolase, C-terminal domain protein [Bordetella holmesii 44057]